MAISKFKKLIAPALSLAILVSLVDGAASADIRPYIYDTGSLREIVIEGNIEPGDFETFMRIVRENQGQISGVYIFSLGGDFYEAMKIGRAMRALELGSTVPIRDSSGIPSCEGFMGFGPKPNDPKNCTCASAGFFIHIGGVHRSGEFMAVHRPYFSNGDFGKLSEPEAEKAFNALQDDARDYMQEMGVPKHIQEDVLGTPSDRAQVLDDKTVKTYFSGDLPSRDEWTRNKCFTLSEAEKQRFENYGHRLMSMTNAAHGDLSDTEWTELHALLKKKDEEGKCAIAINDHRRTDAYERYFGGKPTDYGSQDFTKWSEITKYLGKHFYELLSEEKFEEETSFGSSSLKRAPTASTPYIRLFDSRSKPKIVASISLLSTPSPSPEFIQRLVKSLEGVWGKHLDGNGTTEWVWSKKEFSAKLVHEPASAEGPFLRLHIDEK